MDRHGQGTQVLVLSCYKLGLGSLSILGTLDMKKTTQPSVLNHRPPHQAQATDSFCIGPEFLSIAVWKIHEVDSKADEQIQ